MIWNLRLLSMILLAEAVRTDVDEYLDECQQQCTSKKNIISCAKYRSLRYLSTLGHHYGFLGNGSMDSPVRLVQIQRSQEEPDMFPTARQLSSDSELTKFLKFVKRQVNYYLSSQGILVDLPDGAHVIQDIPGNAIEEGRGKKKKATMVLMPLIILFKLFKIKVMVALVLASLVFIKKAIMLGALVLPSIIQQLKHCSRMSHHHTPYHHVEELHEHDDYGGSYYGGYSKDYDRAYSAYMKNKGQ